MSHMDFSANIFNFFFIARYCSERVSTHILSAEHDASLHTRHMCKKKKAQRLKNNLLLILRKFSFSSIPALTLLQGLPTSIRTLTAQVTFVPFVYCIKWNTECSLWLSALCSLEDPSILLHAIVSYLFSLLSGILLYKYTMTYLSILMMTYI